MTSLFDADLRTGLEGRDPEHRIGHAVLMDAVFDPFLEGWIIPERFVSGAGHWLIGVRQDRFTANNPAKQDTERSFRRSFPPALRRRDVVAAVASADSLNG
jgi:hypothetical protein